MIDIVCVIDKSGSMHDLRNETVGSFNGFLANQQGLEGKAKMTLVLFDNERKVIHLRKNLKKVTPLNANIYRPGGTTALLETVCRTIESVGDAKKVIFMIITDGYENSSHPEFTKELTSELIEEKGKLGWEFHYLGVGIEDFDDALGMGINNMVSNAATAKGIGITYSVTHDAVRDYRIDND